MAYDYEFSNSAFEDLKDILRYIINDLANPVAAKNLSDNIRKTILLICEFPNACPLYKNRYWNKTVLRFKPVGKYLLFYKIDNKRQKVIVTRIIYGQRNIDTMLDHLSDSGDK